MLSILQRPLRLLFVWLELLFDKPFGPPWNPMRQLGTLAFFFFWVAAVTGIYLFIVFDTSVLGAYESIEWMTHDQWYLAGMMRSLHRYSSDAMVVTMVFHLLNEFSLDRYRGPRWFTWFTGVPIIWLLMVSGISGYWLVWDQLAQYVAIGSMEWLDWLSIFGEPVANNFLTRGSIDDRFFSLLVFIHIFGPLFLLFVMWIHILRVNRAQTNPPRGLAMGSLAMLVILSFVFPAVSHPQADLGIVPQELKLDWFYLGFYPIFDWVGPGLFWGLTVGGSIILCAMPWLPRLKEPKAVEVFLDQCNGCTRCFEDCPYSAITMQPRTDGRSFQEEAVVDPDLCTKCGICVGSCPMSTPFRQGDTPLKTGIDLPEFPLDNLLDKITDAMGKVKAEQTPDQPGVLLLGCDHGNDLKSMEKDGMHSVTVPCIGMLPPSFVDFALSRNGVDGVMLTGCSGCDCFHRLGIPWTEDRMAGLRDPYLRKRVPRERIHSHWSGIGEADILENELNAFRDRLSKIEINPAKKEEAE